MQRLLDLPYDPDLYAPRLTAEQAANPVTVLGMTLLVRHWGVHPGDLLEILTNLYRDYTGRYFCPKRGWRDPRTGRFQEVDLPMQFLEDAPLIWWHDQFGKRKPQVQVLRVKVVSVARWRVIGSILGAYYPALAARNFFDIANDDCAPR